MANPTVHGSTKSSNTATISVPTHTDGDLLIVLFNSGAPISTPAGWTAPTGNTKTQGNTYTGYFTRIASSEPASYSVSGTIQALVMYAISGTNGSTTPDGSAFQGANSGTSITTPALTGLSSSTDLLIGAYFYGYGANTGTTISETGSLNLDQNPPYVAGTNLGIWAGNLALAATSASAQTATESSSGQWVGLAIAIAPAAAILGSYRAQPSHRKIIPSLTARYHPHMHLPRIGTGGAMVLFVPTLHHERIVHPKAPPKWKRRHRAQVVDGAVTPVINNPAFRTKFHHKQEVVVPRKVPLKHRMSLGAALLLFSIVIRKRLHRPRKVTLPALRKHPSFRFSQFVAAAIALAAILPKRIIHRAKGSVQTQRKVFHKVFAAGGMLVLFPIPRRGHKPLKLPLVIQAAPPKLTFKQRIKQRIIGFVQAVQAAIDAIVIWRNRGGY